MAQSTKPKRRTGGELDVYTGMLCVAFLVLVAGVALVAMRNLEHSAVDERAQGGIFTLIEQPR